MPQWAARLVGFAALGAVAALEWRRLIAGVSAGRALAWVAVATVAGGALVAAGRLGRRRRPLGLAGAVLGGALAGYVASGAPVSLLKPRHWGDVASSVASGTQSLGTVRLPYDAQDPAPAIALHVIGAELLVLAALVAVWPRARGRGYPFFSLVALMVLIASPVISLGGTRSVGLGAAIAALTICFLWLERLPLRPGIGVAALLGIALAGALPLATSLDRGEPWFDYRAFAEGLGPNDPVRFSWSQSYGPITWPRDGNEVMRVQSDEPMYWKARDLDAFDGIRWHVRSTPQPLQRPGDQPWEADMPEDWRNYPAWTSTIRVSIRRMRTPDVIGAGTTISVTDNSRNVRAGRASGTWDSLGALRRGDSYTAQVHDPKPTGAELQEASAGDDLLVGDDLIVNVPLKPGVRAPGLGPGAPSVYTAEIHFRSWSDSRAPYVSYPSAGRADFDVNRVMRDSLYARTWALAKRLRRGAKSPFDYIVRVDHFLAGPDFRYSERPTPPRPGVPPLDAFLNDTHEGYCQHYAGAMALLLRLGGVPARVATGFSPGGYSQLHHAWVVRDIDAHAWVEAWFDKFGWTTFDPTPDATPARSQIAALAAPPPPISTQPGTRPGTGAPGSSPLIRRPGALRGDLRFDPLRGATVNRPAGGGGAPGWLLLLGVVLAVALVATGAWLLVGARTRRHGTPMDRAIAELEAALRRAGRPLQPGTTLRQLERRLGGSPEVIAYLRALSAGRYAASAAPAPRAGRRALRRALGDGLGPTGRLRALWALPPRPR
jgi:protein-glutamine gamma-glutamyltransferase